MSSLTKAERAEMAERAKRAEAKIERDAAKGDYTSHEVEMALQDIPELLAHIEALEAVVEVTEIVTRLLRSAAAFHEGDEHPVLETAMLDTAVTLEVALQRLQEQEEEKED